ncbi:MAG: hypothetical protein FJ304_13285 [Planctomycetes bacterium]|nr:hypothetical protein [Planctomycetota bacterium]
MRHLNPRCTVKAAKELGKLKAKARDALEALAKVAAEDKDDDVRTVAKNALASIREALDLIGKNDAEKALAPLVKNLKSKKVQDRMEALDKLSKIGEKALPVSASVVEAMMDNNASVREAAAECLERVDPTIHKHVVSLLYDKNELVQERAVASLAKLGSDAKGAAPALRARYAASTNRAPNFDALEALLKVTPNDPVITNEVLRLVGQPPPNPNDFFAGQITNLSREIGLKHLNSLDVPVAKKVTALIAALSDPTARVDAVQRLGKLGADAKAALPALMKLKLDNNVNVRDAVNKAIAAIKDE